MSKGRRSAVVLLVAVVVVGCFEREAYDAPGSSAIAALAHKCISLKVPAYLVTGADEDWSDSYLVSPANPPNTGTLLPAGQQLIVIRIVLKHSFEGRYAIVVGKCAGARRCGNKKINLFYVFDQQWLHAAQEAAFEGHPNSPTGFASVLSPERAEWCN